MMQSSKEINQPKGKEGKDMKLYNVTIENNGKTYNVQCCGSSARAVKKMIDGVNGNHVLAVKCCG